ncbi:MAG: hypothetical protein U0992_08770 [Planctomycetaceae bacterium]
MNARIRHLLRSTAPRESSRIDLGLIRGALIVAMMIALLPSRLPPVLGPLALRSVAGFSLLFVFVLAARLGSDSVGDVRTGFLGLIQLAGTRPWQWIAVRQAQMWIGFVSVWIVRAPILAFLPALGGGLRWQAILATELALLLAFFVLSNLSLVIAFGAASRRHVGGRIFGVLFVWNTLLVLPSAIVGSLAVTWPQFVGQELLEALTWVSSFGPYSQFALVSSANADWGELWPGAALYSGIGLLFLGIFWRQVRTVGTMLPEERVGPRPDARRAAARESRRCWDDALAWQAFVFVGRGNRMVVGKIVGYLLLAFLAWNAVAFGYQWLPMIALPVLCGGLLMNAINKTGECLTREINEKTIGTLLLTPHNFTDLAAGWRRGARRLALPDLLLWACMTIGSQLVSPYVPPVMLCIAMVLVASDYFFILSPLMPFTFLGVTMGLALIFLFIAVASVCVLAAMWVHPWIAPAVLAPLLLGFTQVLKRALPYWMEKKIASAM